LIQAVWAKGISAQQGSIGQNVSFEIAEGNLLERGDILVKNPADFQVSCKVLVKCCHFSEEDLFEGKPYILKIGTQERICRVKTLLEKLEPTTGQINSNPDPEKDIQTLKWIVKKPLAIEVFFHNKSVSENITASSISPIEIRLQRMEIKLFVFKKEPFHEVSAELIVHDKAYPIKALPLIFSYFIQIGKTFNLVPDAALLRVLEYYKTHHEKVLIHSSQFEDFQKNILAELENRITIQYAYIAPATKKQQIEFFCVNTG
jgi:hypothetical protein